MMRNKKRTLMIAVLSMIMLLSTAGMAFGVTVSGSVTGNRLSNTAVSAHAVAGFNATASYAKCTLTLQEKYNGGWRTATGIVVTKVVREKYNVKSISASYKFALIKGKNYRLKAAFTDKRNGVKSTNYYYSSTF